MKTSKSIITVVVAPFKDVNGELVSCFAIDWQFPDPNPINVGVEIYFDSVDGQAISPELFKHLLVMLQPNVVGGTHVIA